ncbi:MAG: sigma-54-dependent Fis family transcriptional regulator [Bacteroidales bacterium]|nr:sigma-54-dependent Fis family transcriptional regulator [Bacteroidales bacterium]
MKIYEQILSIAESIAMIREKKRLFDTIHHQLKSLFEYKLSGIVLLEADSNIGKFFWSGEELSAEAAQKMQIPVDFSKVFLNSTPDPLDIIRLDLPNTPIPEEIREANNLIVNYAIKEVLFIPLRSSGQTIGYLTLACEQYRTIKTQDHPLLSGISNLVAIAVTNTLAWENSEIQQHENQFQLEFTNEVLPVINQPDVFRYLASSLNKRIDFDFFNIVVLSHNLEANIELAYMKEDNKFRFIRIPTEIILDEGDMELLEKHHPNHDKVVRLTTNELNLVSRNETVQQFIKEELQMNTAAVILLKSFSDTSVFLFLASRNPDAFTLSETDLLQKLTPQLQLILENYYAFLEINNLRMQLEQEKHTLVNEINEKGGEDHFIAHSKTMINVLRRVKQVAPIDTTVLIQGETGVGKELIARALHTFSPRNNAPMIRVNCAALPAQLIESELFGHEQGSFTGATERRIGKFEMANGGTIFLDEIGEIPIELQAKLLRVLQEKEFERIGGKSLIHCDVRIVAATNRNLETEVEKGNFRSDLFFRLNVFPVLIPPLRERQEDIPYFAEYFLGKFARRLGKPSMQITNDDLQRLIQHRWPGNIRELEHVIEKAVILTNSDQLNLDDFHPAQASNSRNSLPENFRSLKDLETEHILLALQLAQGRVSGEKGAAKLLGINGKTLDSKMRKLGIRREINIRVD